MTAIYEVNKVLPRMQAVAPGAVESGNWHWEMPSLSDIGLVFKDGIKAFAIEDNRRFIFQFFKGGKFNVTQIKGQWMITFRGTPGLRKWVTGTTYSLEGEPPKFAVKPAPA